MSSEIAPQAPATAPAAAVQPIADFQIEGMTCASCVARVEKAIRAVPGVASANVNLATEKATVVFAKEVDAQSVVAAVEKVGYPRVPMWSSCKSKA